MSRSKRYSTTLRSLAAILALTTASCTPVRMDLRPLEIVADGASSWIAKSSALAGRLTQKPRVAIAAAARDIAPVPSPQRCEQPPRRESIRVVAARVDARRRVVSADAGRAPLDPRVGILARQLGPTGKLERGTVVYAVFRTVEADVTDALSDERACSAAKKESSLAGAGGAVDGELLAVQRGSGPGARRAFLVSDAEGVSAFYARDGRAVEGTHLRYPVEYLQVTSGFGTRPHPILKKRKPHLGVDFAAPRGTPVVSVADGEVVSAGWAGPHGRKVDIRHGDGSITGYSHLDRIEAGIAAGKLVRKGEVIGTVGASGWATGPHLHFSLQRGGKHVDPLAAATPPSPKLTAVGLARLRDAADDLELAIAAAEHGKDPSAAQLALGASAGVTASTTP